MNATGKEPPAEGIHMQFCMAILDFSHSYQLALEELSPPKNSTIRLDVAERHTAIWPDGQATKLGQDRVSRVLGRYL